MTGHHGKRGTSDSRRRKRVERSNPEAAAEAPPPAHRTRHAEGPAARRRTEAPAPTPPQGCGSVPAARPPSLPCGCGVTVALPPPAGPADPPPKCVWPRTAYRLRNRKVPDTRKPKPVPVPMPRPRLDDKEIKEKPKRDPSRQTAMCARVGLRYYNRMNKGDEHELVKAVSSNGFLFNGIWYHANFLAKRKGATNCVDLVPKYFFAELVTEDVGHSCVSCVKLEPGDPKNIGGCRLCSEKMMHPAGGRYCGAQPRSVRHAPGGLQISFSF